ncbi:MAG TPA: SMI1/KNR4 family protein [Mucilaginibacter sp.]|jgi:hypothetical protein
MTIIEKKEAPSNKEITNFLEGIDFELPKGFIEFFSLSNGALIRGKSENVYVILWPLTDMVKLNEEYKVDEFAPGFFIFGSDGGGTAYCIEKNTSCIYNMQFIGMSEDLTFICKTFAEFLQTLGLQTK